jgi:hypothetical protein
MQVSDKTAMPSASTPRMLNIDQMPVMEPDRFAAGLSIQALPSQRVMVPLTDALVAAVLW